MRNFKSFWTQSSFSYKFYALSSIAIFYVTLGQPSFSKYFFDTNGMLAFIYAKSPLALDIIAQYNLQDLYHPEALFFSFYGNLPILQSSINLLFSLAWLSMLMTDKECGTLYTLVEVILINFQVHVVYGLLILLLAYIPQQRMPFETLFYASGWGPILVVYELRQAMKNTEEEKIFFFLPFTIKSKYSTWFTILFFTAWTKQIVCIIAAIIVGFVQESVMENMIIRLPFCFYKITEYCIPKFLKHRYDYVVISQLNKKRLKDRCLKLCHYRAPFSGPAVRIGGDLQPNQAQFRGSGVRIGGLGENE